MEKKQGKKLIQKFDNEKKGDFEEKLPELICPFCGRKLIRYKDVWICGHGCTKPAMKSKATEPEKEYPKVVYQLGSDSKEYIELKEKYDKLIEDIQDDLEEIMGWCYGLPVDSEIVIRLGRKQEKYEGMLKR